MIKFCESLGGSQFLSTFAGILITQKIENDEKDIDIHGRDSDGHGCRHIGVTEGNQLGVMYALARINQRPTDRDVIMLVNETFLGITVYIYTFSDCFVSGTTDWKTWKGWNYTGNAFNDPCGHTYNKIK